MKLDKATIEKLAEHLENCQLQAKDTTKITDDYPEMDWDDAYAIQNVIKARKLARGLKLGGLKAGLTSHAKMKQMGVTTPVFGFMTKDYEIADGGDCKTSELIHPKVEPEIAFMTNKPLRGPGCHIAAVLAATEYVIPGIEVIDSRYRDFKFDLKSVVADNTSAARYVVGGQKLDVKNADLRTTGIVLEKNGQPVVFDLPDLYMKNLGKAENGLSPGQLGQVIVSALKKELIATVNFTKLANGALDVAADLAKTVQESPGEVVNKLKSLF